MTHILFIEYPSCSTCKKAKKWLRERSVCFEERNIVESKPRVFELKAWHEKSGLALRRFFNTSGKLYRELGIKQKLDEGLSDEDAYELLASNGMLIKRPLLIIDGIPCSPGFKEAEWEQAITAIASANAALIRKKENEQACDGIKQGGFEAELEAAALAAAQSAIEEGRIGDTFGTVHTIQINDMPMQYLEAGAGKPIVLIHGNGGSHLDFDLQIRQLSVAGYRVIAPDSRGHGDSPKLDEYHYADMTEDVYQLIQALDLDKPAVYGWSDGGIIALLLGMAHSECCSSLIVSGANLSSNALGEALIADFEKGYAATHDPLLRLMLDEPHITAEELGFINVPVLVTAGTNDVVSQEHTELIAQSIPNAQVAIVEGADHFSYIMESPIIGELILDFLEEQAY